MNSFQYSKNTTIILLINTNKNNIIRLNSYFYIWWLARRYACRKKRLGITAVAQNTLVMGHIYYIFNLLDLGMQSKR